MIAASCAGCAVLWTWLQTGPLPAPPAQDQKPPTFRSGVELLAVDVSVVDKTGRPVPDLGSKDFRVEVGGRPRQVVRAEYLDFSLAPAASAELTDFSSNQSDTAGPEPRSVLLLIDDESFDPGEGKAVFLKLADSLEKLVPRDPLALAVLSGRHRGVEFTTDRKPIADALRMLVGARTPRSFVGLRNVGLSEAFDIVRGGSFSALSSVVDRECADEARGPGYEACRQDVESQAREMVNETERQATTTLGGLSRVFSAMAGVPGTKHVLLVSAGFAIGHSPELATSLSGEAAAAGVTLHAFFVDRGVSFDASQRMVSPTGTSDNRMLAEGLELAVGASGGALHRVIGDPSNAIERVRRELSGAYRLGVEMDATDADGKARSIEVKVARAGLTVRAHRQIVAPVSTRSLPPAERLKRALASPLLERGIAVRVGAFGFRDDNGAGQIVVSAEADAESAGLQAAYLVRDPRGKLIAAGDLAPDAIVAERDAPPLVVFRTSVPPGDYTLKLALVDASGRAGSAVRPVSIRGGTPAPVALGDLIVLPEGVDTARVRPSARIEQGSRRASVYFEVYGASTPARSRDVRLEVAESPDGPALVTSRGEVDLRARGRLARVAGQLRFSPATLPPGRYFARLSVEGTEARAVRGFTVVAGASAAALLPDESRALIPPFHVNRFLSQPLLQSIARRLEPQAAQNAAVQNAIDALEAGTWREVPPDTGDALTDATLRGLQALVAGQAADAERAFRDALDQDPEFTLALALAGGAWAAVGRDREASRSWRTSLATGVEAPYLYESIAHALLRTGDVKGAREFFGEVEETGSGAEAITKWRALAAAIEGNRRLASETLAAWVDGHPDDLESSFLLVLALYELKTIEKDQPAAASFAARAKQYIERGGPRAALVQRWMR